MSQGPALSDLSVDELRQVIAGAERAEEEIKRRYAFLLYQPMPYQLEWHQCTKPILLALCGNRTGKSTFATVEVIRLATGVDPIALGGTMLSEYPKGNRKGVSILCLGDTMDRSVRHTLLKKFKHYVHPDMLDGTPRMSLGVEVEWHFKSGARVIFGSYEQPKGVFEGPDWDFVLYDEAPKKEIFQACHRGTIDRGGRQMVTATPREGAAWLWDDLYLPSLKPESENFERVAYFRVDTHRNCILAGERVSGSFVGGLKALYSGPAVEVETVGGKLLRVTVNHPVLTGRGLVAAGSLHEGDTLLREKVEVVDGLSGRKEKEEYRQDATVEEVFQALAAHGAGVSKGDALDLNGDERFFVRQEVHTVGLLVRAEEAGLVLHGNAHALAQGGFKAAQPATQLTSFPHRASRPPSGGPGFSQGALYLASVVPGLTPPKPLRLGRAANLNAVLPKAALQSERVAASFVRELLGRFPGEIALDEVRHVRHFDFVGHVYDFATPVGYFATDNIIVRNCFEHHGGHIPHAEMMAFFGSLSEPERAMRQRGFFLDHQEIAFHYVREDTHVVPDFDRPPSWPIIEICDPSMTRGLHVGWFTCSPEDEWFWIDYQLIADGSFKHMCLDLKRARRRIGREPDIAIMDKRGGGWRINKMEERNWFQEFRVNGVTYIPSVDTPLQKLHDWLEPRWNPSTERESPKLRLTASVAALEKGPLWAFSRFKWDPTESSRRQDMQPAKDLVDIAKYLVGFPGLTWERYGREGGRASVNGKKLVESYQRQSPKQRQTTLRLFTSRRHKAMAVFQRGI